MPRYSKTERAEAIERLRKWLPPGSTVYTILRHVSRSGMSRDISVMVIRKGEALHPNHAVSRAIEATLVSAMGSDAVRVGGCGMDMGFHIVNNLSYVIHGSHKDSPLIARWNKRHPKKPPMRPAYTLNHRWL